MPGPARRAEGPLRERGHVHVPEDKSEFTSSPGWATSRWRNKESRGGTDRGRREPRLAAWALVPPCSWRWRWRSSSRRATASSISWAARPAGRRVRRPPSGFRAGEIRIQVRNPQRDDLTIASVTVDDAIVPFTLDGPSTLGRLRSSTIAVPDDRVDEEPIAVGVTSSMGIETVDEIPAAVLTPQPSARSFLGYGLIGLVVGSSPSRSACSGCRRCDAPTRVGSPRSCADRRPADSSAWRRSPRHLSSSGAARRRRRRRPRRLGEPERARHHVLLRATPARPRRVTGLALALLVARRDRRPQPRRRPCDRHVVRNRRAPARRVPRDRVHGAQHHPGARDRGTGERRRGCSCSSPVSR